MNKVIILNSGSRKTVQVSALRVETDTYYFSTTMQHRENKVVGS